LVCAEVHADDAPGRADRLSKDGEREAGTAAEVKNRIARPQPQPVNRFPSHACGEPGDGE
jgi:hypothetical protein